MTREEFEKGIGRELGKWEHWNQIEKVYSRVDNIWNNKDEFFEWYEIQGYAASAVIDRYCDIIDEYDQTIRQLNTLQSRVATIQKYLCITE